MIKTTLQQAGRAYRESTVLFMAALNQVVRGKDKALVAMAALSPELLDDELCRDMFVVAVKDVRTRTAN